MAIFVSSLIRSMDGMEGIATWVDQLRDPQVGVELIAFTHDEAYWERLEKTLQGLTCPRTFHGPYVGTEGACSPDSPEQAHLFASYRRTFYLAERYRAAHVVYHFTQTTFAADTAAPVIDKRRHQAEANALAIQALADEYGVTVLFENLPCPGTRLPLHTNAQYMAFLDANPATRTIIDIGHANMNGLDVASFIERYGPRVESYHFHNNDGERDQHKDIFEGTFDYDAFAPAFRRHTPHADIVLEYEPHVQLSGAELLARVDYLKRVYLA